MKLRGREWTVRIIGLKVPVHQIIVIVERITEVMMLDRRKAKAGQVAKEWEVWSWHVRGQILVSGEPRIWSRGYSPGRKEKVICGSEVLGWCCLCVCGNHCLYLCVSTYCSSKSGNPRECPGNLQSTASWSKAQLIPGLWNMGWEQSWETEPLWNLMLSLGSSELSWITGYPSRVWELLRGVVGKCHTLLESEH